MVHRELIGAKADEDFIIPVTRLQLTAIIVLLVLSIVGGVSLAYLLIGGGATENRKDIESGRTRLVSNCKSSNVGALVAPHNLKGDL